MNATRKLKDLLLRTGLTDDEVRIFFAILRSPGNSIYGISKLVGIPKDRAYNIVESLEDKKLIARTPGGLKCNPITRYGERLQSQSRRFNRIADALREMDPFMPFLGAVNDEESFYTFNHEQAGEQFLDLSYLKWDQVHAYGDFDTLLDTIKEDIDRKFVRNRLKRGKQCMAVCANPKDYTLKTVIGRDVLEKRVTKLLYDKNFDNFFVAVFPDIQRTTIWQKQDNGRYVGAIFNNPLISKVHERMHNYLFNISDYYGFRENSEIPA